MKNESLLHDHEPGSIELAVKIVDASNCVAWHLRYRQRTLPRWEKVTG